MIKECSKIDTQTMSILTEIEKSIDKTVKTLVAKLTNW
jgi:hypothetical protein